MRRVCIENMPKFVEKLKPSESLIFVQFLAFLEESFRDESKWVRNQAYHQLGKVVYVIFEKAKEPGADKA